MLIYLAKIQKQLPHIAPEFGPTRDRNAAPQYITLHLQNHCICSIASPGAQKPQCFYLDIQLSTIFSFLA